MIYDPSVIERSILFNHLETTGLSACFTDVISEIVELLPIVIPVLVSFLALRKGISFVRRLLQTA